MVLEQLLFYEIIIIKFSQFYNTNIIIDYSYYSNEYIL